MNSKVCAPLFTNLTTENFMTTLHAAIAEKDLIVKLIVKKLYC